MNKSTGKERKRVVARRKPEGRVRILLLGGKDVMIGRVHGAGTNHYISTRYGHKVLWTTWYLSVVLSFQALAT